MQLEMTDRRQNCPVTLEVIPKLKHGGTGTRLFDGVTNASVIVQKKYESLDIISND
jgi:hypothetical protein